MKRNGLNLIRSVARLALGRRLPTVNGTLHVPGLVGELRIDRDANGVPYIWADNDDDAWFGLGFCHGQDRAGQLEIALRMVRGTLSAVAGADTLPLDRLSRRLGLRRAGLAQIKVQDADIQRQIEAYTRGINAALVTGAKRNAPEFVLLQCEPTPWEAADVQGLVVLVCFALASNWDIELMRLSAVAKDGPEALLALDAEYPQWLPSAMSHYRSSTDGPGGPGLNLEALGEEIRRFGEVFGMVGGSNAWAVSAAKTATGRPLLANDPHMLPAAPSQWYLASIRTPEWGCIGGSFVGVPGQCTGHNGHAAWGITAAHVDHTDLFIEELGPNGTIRKGDGFETCPILHEVIEVKGGREVIEEVLITPRGPIFSPAVNGNGCPVALSISATWLATRPNRGLLAIHRARTADDFRETFRKAAGSNAGLVFVADDGTIGMQVSAEVPIRRQGGSYLPAPGWDPNFGWDGLVPPEDMPRVLSPDNGIVAMANAQPESPGDGGPDLGVDWLDGFRLARIIEALEGHDAWTLDGMLALQRDHKSLAWPPLAEIIADIDSDDGSVVRAKHMLAGWDGQVRPTSAEASLYEFWLAELIGRVVRAKAPRSADELLGKGTTAFLPNNLILTRRVGHLISLLHAQPEGWFGPGRTWNQVIGESLGTALKTLESRYGPPSEAWQWGRIRPLVLKHPFSEKPPIDRVFDIGPVWCGGDATTIPQAGVDLRDTTANPTSVATMRVVIDVGNWDNSRYVLLGGQSGNPFSKHYDDHVAAWERGDGFRIFWSHNLAEAAAVSTLRLRRQ